MVAERPRTVFVRGRGTEEAAGIETGDEVEDGGDEGSAASTVEADAEDVERL